MKFSIIIICCNQDDVIANAVDSAVAQNYHDREIIVVDDGSTDQSVQIIEQHAAGQAKLICHKENRGAYEARKTGLEAASGDYILFLDGDDLLKEDCCRKLNEILSKQHYDVVAFSTEVSFPDLCPPEEKLGTERYMRPYIGHLSEGDIFRNCFIERKMPWNIIMMCHYAPLARQTHFEIEAVREGRAVLKSDDYLFFFVESHIAKDYLGIEDKLYVYNYGNGVSSNFKPTRARLLHRLKVYETEELCIAFAKSRGIYDDEHKTAVDTIRSDDVLGIFNIINELTPAERDEVMENLLAKYGEKKVITSIAQRYHGDAYTFENFNISKLFPMKKRSVKTVAMYYERLYNGGIERVISCLCGILTKEGYRLVVVTEEEENEKDYLLPEGVKRVVIGKLGDNVDYAERFAKWMQCIEEYDIDAVVYHKWGADSLFHDMCVIKSSGAAFFMHSHGIFTSAIIGGLTVITDAGGAVKHADALVVLSEEDRLYWQRFNNNIHCVINPMSFDIASVAPSPLNSHSVLWLGRFDNMQKNPVDALYIMKKILNYIPDATLTMVGEMSAETEKHFRESIDALGLDSHVFLTGYSLDVEKYYSAASVMLVTSSYEGYPMTMIEALSFGLPIVSYDMPYLSVIKNCSAVKTVPWKNLDAAAQSVAELLYDETARKDAGAQSREYTEKLASHDFGTMWKEILNSVLVPHAAAVSTVSLEEFAAFVKTVELTFRQSAATIKSLNIRCEEYEDIISSFRYRIGNVLMFVPSTIKRFFMLRKKFGLKETLNIIKKTK